MRGIQRFVALHPRRARALAGVAVAVAVALLLAHANPMCLIFLQDHPLSANAALVPAGPLMVLAMVLLLPSGQVARTATGRRTGPLVFVAGFAVMVLYCGGALVLESPDAWVRRGHDLADDVFTADGHYELRVFSWNLGAGHDYWDVLVERRSAIRFVAVEAGCLSATVTPYRGVDSFEPGHASLATADGVVDIEFDAQTMHVTTPVPARLCPDE